MTPDGAAPAPPGSAGLLPLFAAILALECALGFAAGECMEHARTAAVHGEYPAWLTYGAPATLAPQMAAQQAGHALTLVVRLMQVALAFGWLRRNPHLASACGLAFAWSRRAWATAAGALAVVAAGSGALEAVFRACGSAFVKPILLSGGPEPAHGSWPHLALLLAVQALVGPLAEEVVCRGLIYVPLRRRRGVVVGAVLSALVFAALHRTLDPLAFAIVTVGGLLFAGACEIGRGLAAPFVFHVAYNAAILLLRHPRVWA